MVRRPGRLPPSNRSVEEVVLARRLSTQHRRNATFRAPNSNSIMDEEESGNMSSFNHYFKHPNEAIAAQSQVVSREVRPVGRRDRKVTMAAIGDIVEGRRRDTHGNLGYIAHQYEMLTDRVKVIEADYNNFLNRQVDNRVKTEIQTSLRKIDRKPFENKKKQLQLSSELKTTVTELSNTVARLDHVFMDLASVKEKRIRAATQIAKTIRGHLIRLQYKDFQLGLRNWRQRFALRFISAVQQFKERDEDIFRGIDKMAADRSARLQKSIYTAWKKYTLLKLPGVKERLRLAEDSFRRIQKRTMVSILRSWHERATGPRSRKQLQLNYKNRVHAAREFLESLGRYTVITSEMVHTEVQTNIVRVVRARHAYHTYRVVWRALMDHVFLPYKDNVRFSKEHYNTTLLRRIAVMWISYYKASRGNDRSLSRSTGSGWIRFGTRHNVNTIEHYANTNLLKRHFKGWVSHAIKYKEVRIRFEKATQRTLLHVLQSIHVQAKYQARLRRLVVKEWKNYSNRIFRIPFRAWLIYAFERRAKHRTQEALIQAYRRKCSRHSKYCMFRSWKHQVMHGQVGAVNSKIELIKALEDQRAYCVSLEDNITALNRNVADLHRQVKEGEERTTEKQAELESVHKVNEARRFALHHAQQQLALHQGIVDSIAEIHPATVDRVRQNLEQLDQPVLDFELVKLARVHNEALKAKREAESGEYDSDEEAPSAVSHTDRLLLKRIKWVLSRMLLHPDQHPKTSSPELPEALQDPNQEPDIEHLSSEAEQMYALFEFIRTGDTGPLLPANRPGRSGQLNLRKQRMHSIDAGVDLRPPSQENRLIEPTNKSTVVSKTEMSSKSDKWSDFLQATTHKFPPRRRVPVDEQLVRRVAHVKKLCIPKKGLIAAINQTGITNQRGTASEKQME